MKFNERPIEYAFVFKWLTRTYPKSILDVGCGKTSLPALMKTCGFDVTAIDKNPTNQHFHVIQDDIVKTQLKRKFHFITCVSVLEHIKDFDRAVANMLGLLEPGGYLIMTFPFSKDYIPNVYDLPGSSYGQDFSFITQSFNFDNIMKWIEGIYRQLNCEFWKFFTGSFWTEGEKLIPPKEVDLSEGPQLACLGIKA